jgi:Transposase DDE domain
VQLTLPTPPLPAVGAAFSVAFAERILRHADALDLPQAWDRLTLGNPSRRATAYPTRHRLAAVLAGLACGLRGVGPGNTFLRPNAALRARTGGRFPDQGTIHRWLGQVTAEQAAAWRDHLHRVVAAHGRFREALWHGGPLTVDIDGQGLVARGGRFEKAELGWLGEGVDKGYLRYVCYAAETGEVLDEWLAPGNKTLMSQLPQLLDGLDAVIPKAQRRQVVARGDSHLGTIGNLLDLKRRGYHYLCPLQSWAATKRLKRAIAQAQGGSFRETDSAGAAWRVRFWVLPRWRLTGKGGRRPVRTRATVYRAVRGDGLERWSALVTDLKRARGPGLWRRYHERGGTIEEYNDQAERAYHLGVVRTGNFAGLQALHALVGLCWDLTRWATEDLRLPPLQAPAAPAGRWQEAARLDLSAVQGRAACSGLRLYRRGPGAVLEVEDTAQTAESAAWLAWLRQPVQLLLLLSG